MRAMLEGVNLSAVRYITLMWLKFYCYSNMMGYFYNNLLKCTTLLIITVLIVSVHARHVLLHITSDCMHGMAQTEV